MWEPIKTINVRQKCWWCPRFTAPVAANYRDCGSSVLPLLSDAQFLGGMKQTPAQSSFQNQVFERQGLMDMRAIHPS